MGIELTDEQVHALYHIENWWRKADKQVFELTAPAGAGKAIPIDTIIPTPLGDRKLDDLQVGDFVYDLYGQPTMILGIYDQGELDTYKVTFHDGRTALCNDEHLWTYVKYDKNKNRIKFVTNPLSVMIKIGLYDKNGKHRFAVPNSLLYKKKYFVNRNYSFITNIEKLDYKSHMKCIYVNNKEHLFLMNDYIVTHNTTLIRYFIDYIDLDMNDVAFLAFMGKAASQMSRNGLRAQTIHSFIYEYKKIAATDENGNILVDSNWKPIKKGVFEKRSKLPFKPKLIVVDEAGMVSEKIALDLLSFNIPVIALGDLNQLPPVFGKPYFLKNPDYKLTRIMRQAENDPIVWLAHRVLNDKPLNISVYGKSAVISKDTLSNNELLLNNVDVVLTSTNSLRFAINKLFRERIKSIRRLDTPQVGEKIICRKNNWSKEIGNNLYLTNGLNGFITYHELSKYNNNSFTIDFRPDFAKKSFKNLKIDSERLMSMDPINVMENNKMSFGKELFEFSYAITIHLSQGSQYEKVMLLSEREKFNNEMYKKLMYTGITRASKELTIVV